MNDLQDGTTNPDPNKMIDVWVQIAAPRIAREILEEMENKKSEERRENLE